FFPSLVSRLAGLEADDAISAVLNGNFSRGGDLGGHSVPLMPSWANLGNEQVADILNYLGGLTKSGFERVTVEQVAAIRASGSQTPEQQPIIRTELDRAADLYNHRCAVCHGVDRQGAAGSALQAFRMRDVGTQQIRSILHYGTPWGMPNWGTSDRLSPEDMQLLARYLVLDVTPSAVLSPDSVLKGWRNVVDRKDRPTRREFAQSADNLFVSLLHDTGHIALIDAVNKIVLSVIDTGIAPHQIELSADDRLLYVLSRGGELVMIDLFMAQPQVVASVRIGYEARSFAVQDDYLVAGAYSPAQYSVLDARTLKPLETRSLAPINGVEQSIGQVSALHQHSVLITTRAQGNLYRLDLQATDASNQATLLGTYPLLQPGVPDLKNQKLMYPTDHGNVIVVNRKTGEVEKTFLVSDLSKASSGATLQSPTSGVLWAVGSMYAKEIQMISVEAQEVIARLALPGGGSFSQAAHRSSTRLWADMALNSDPNFSGSVLTFDLNDLEAPPRQIPITSPIKEQSTTARVIYPQFNAAGDEIWLTVYDRQDRGSSIVVLDEKTGEIKNVIDDARLITPIRTVGLANLQESQ
ncbi:MAG: c-type cytochrome, partial [Proteobacteria bacterium]|nr:c-type cytochrome [Pseudomonadota bacterium]